MHYGKLKTTESEFALIVWWQQVLHFSEADLHLVFACEIMNNVHRSIGLVEISQLRFM